MPTILETEIKAVLAVTTFGLICAPQMFAQSQPTPAASAPSFEVASIKPDKSGSGMIGLRMGSGDRFEAHNITLQLLIAQAFGIRDSQLSGGPAWMNTDHYDIEAKPDEATAAALGKLNEEQRRQQVMLMVQSLLADRFKLQVRHETKELPIYALVVAKNGPKLHESDFKPSDRPPSGPGANDGPPGGPKGGLQPGPNDRPMPMPIKGGMMLNGRGHLTSNGVQLSRFAEILSRVLGRPVIDKTGLTGYYDFDLQWTPDESQGAMMPGGGPGPGGPGGPGGAGAPGPGGAGPGDAPPPDASGPNIFTAVQEQLGLKLESQKGPVEQLIIEHVEKPSEN